MTEDEARIWLESKLHVPRGTMDRLSAFADLLREANQRQNLVSAASLDRLWARHIADSAQLLLHAPPAANTWIDLGTGAGMPGLIIAMCWHGEVNLVESRKLRGAFLAEAVAKLKLTNTQVVPCSVQQAPLPVQDVISARAFASLDKTLALGARFAGATTRWILPKGASAQVELAAAESSWQGRFQLAGSVTDVSAGIILADGLPKRRKRT